MLRVGLTGGIGSGKSSVAAMLTASGAVVIDSDRLAREVVDPGTPGLARVVEAFGQDLLAADGTLDRAAMASLVFTDPTARQRLEAIIHPLVRDRAAQLQRAAAAENPDVIVVQDVPLLLETGRHRHFDVIVVVDAPVEVAERRLVSDRGYTPDEARRRVAAQATREQRNAIADLVLDNSGTKADLLRQVQQLWQELSRRAAAGGH